MTKKPGRFEFLEHTADVYIAAYGKNLVEAFENSAVAMFETMTDIENVKPRFQQSIKAEGKDKQALLYSWLENLLVKFELEEMLYSRFEIEGVKETGEGFKLKAKIWGEPFDVKKHKQKVGVKAVTYHCMKIDEAPKRITMKFILDI